MGIVSFRKESQNFGDHQGFWFKDKEKFPSLSTPHTLCCLPAATRKNIVSAPSSPCDNPIGSHSFMIIELRPPERVVRKMCVAPLPTFAGAPASSRQAAVSSILRGSIERNAQGPRRLSRFFFTRDTSVTYRQNLGRGHHGRKR